VPGSPPALVGAATWVGWGLLTGLAAFFAVSDHRRARRHQAELLVRSERADALTGRLASAVEQTADGVLITDRDGIIEYVNPAFERITGYSSAEAVGATPRLLRSEEQGADFYADLWATILRGEPFRGTLVNRRRNGRLFSAEQTITPMRNPQTGEISHFVSVLRDLTERTRLREQETELRLAAAVQRRLYPDPLPVVAGFDIAGSMVPALTTCGDYFDLVALPDGRLAIVVADACGHGVGPALIMAETRALLRSALRTQCTIEEVIREVNRQLFADLEAHLYVTMVLGLLEPATGTLTWVNMGHPGGFVLDCDGAEVSKLASTCLPLGLFPHLGDDPGRITLLSHGDLLVLVTDGVQEARSPAERELGPGAVCDVVRRCRQGTAGEIAAAVIAAARHHAGGRPQEDDMTVIVIKRNGREA
jgi:sigma-B regulation protein RsbU (phosphoserine phosphatase)